MNPEQKQVLNFVLKSRDSAVAISGAAGTGKTAVLQELHRGLVDAGRVVHAVAPTMTAVEELKHWEPYRSFRTAFETACDRANLRDVTPHVLRHTFASRLVMQGVDLRTAQELGGWKSLNMVQRYAHGSQDHKRRAVELLVENSTPLITPLPEAASRSESANLHVLNRMGR